jgi:hypothetical protein
MGPSAKLVCLGVKGYIPPIVIKVVKTKGLEKGHFVRCRKETG